MTGSADEHKIRFGILSTASIAQKVVGIMNNSKHATPVCVGARDLKKAEEFAQKHKIGRAYGSYDEVINDKDVEAVYIPIPTALRLDWVVKAAEAKKHVLVEKPFASADQVKKMQEACVKNGVHFMDNTMHLHHLRTKYVAENYLDVSSDAFELNRVNNTFSFELMKREYPSGIRFDKNLEPMGALGDLGWYCVRNILWAFRYQKPLSVVATGEIDGATGIVIECSAILKFSDGKSAGFNCSFRDVTRQHTELVGPKSVIKYNGYVIPFENEPYVFPRDSYELHQKITVVDGCGMEKDIKIDACDQVINLFEQFARDAKDAESAEARKWAEETLLTTTVLDALMESIKKDGQSVRL